MIGLLQKVAGDSLECRFPWVSGKHLNNLPLLLAHRIKAITADFGSAHRGSIPRGPMNQPLNGSFIWKPKKKNVLRVV